MSSTSKLYIRRVVSSRHRETVSSILRMILGPYWKRIGFRRIDRASLDALSSERSVEPELKIIPYFLSDTGAAFDVGANRGEYTYVLEGSVGPENVFAIEPVAHLSRELRRLFPRVHVLRMALSNGPGTLSLKTPVVNGSPLWTRSTLERFVEEGETGALVEDVPVLSLDQLCEQLQVRKVQLIKIDVEGHEESVLEGARNILKTSRPVLLVEIEQRHHTKPITEIFAGLEEQGYVGAYFDRTTPSMRSLKTFSVQEHQDTKNIGNSRYINNFFFVDSSKGQDLFRTVESRCGLGGNARQA